MRKTADEALLFLGLAIELKKAIVRVRRTKPNAAVRLSIRFQAVLRRICDLEAGRRPHPWQVGT